MCELRLYLNPAVEERRNRTLPVQRVRPLPQDERHQSTSHQATETPGKCTAVDYCILIILTVYITLSCLNITVINEGDLI